MIVPKHCADYIPYRMKFVMHFPIIIVVTLVFARIQSNMIEASTTAHPANTLELLRFDRRLLILCAHTSCRPNERPGPTPVWARLKISLFAEIERDLIAERTKEGLVAAKAKGKRLGRPKGALGKSKPDGKEQEIQPEAMAFGLRTSPYHFEILAFWDDPAQSEANRQWVRAFFAATQPFSSGEVYVNSLDQDETQRIREAYSTNYERLVALKRLYDPTNFFRCNLNIAPTGL